MLGQSKQSMIGLQRAQTLHQKKSFSLVLLMVLSLFSAIELGAMHANASSADSDGDGMPLGLEYILGLSDSDWDFDGDELPDGYEWTFGMDPSNQDNPQTDDSDGDGVSNWLEYQYGMPANWDNPATPNILDQGVFYSGMIPVSNWNEEGVSFASANDAHDCPNAGSFECDEDPPGNICTDGLDNDNDGFVDGSDPDNDGDVDCASNDDDGDGFEDEDPDGQDSDGDGMPDGYEYSVGLDPTDRNGSEGAFGDKDGDGLENIAEYINPSWDTSCDGGNNNCFAPEVTQTLPCNPLNGCLNLVAEVDGDTETNATDPDSDNDGLLDGEERTIKTDPTEVDTDSDNCSDFVEVNGAYGVPAQPSDPRSQDTDLDGLLDDEEDLNCNGVVDAGETDPTRPESAEDSDKDGIFDYVENNSCTFWNVSDSDYGGVNDTNEYSTFLVGGQFSNANVTWGYTNACDSYINFETTATVYTPGVNILTLLDTSGFNPSGGIAYYNDSISYTEFAYTSVQGLTLRGVVVAPPSEPIAVEHRNGSWCHDALSGSFPAYCDDDFEDSDGDGLADWQEELIYDTNKNAADTDSDGKNDFEEVVEDLTDPNQPCENDLDTDEDGLNDYFETSVDCELIYIGLPNPPGATDTYVTDPNDVDTDSGGVWDGQEYVDQTNPEDNPADDIQPSDFDGDGLSDTYENLTGTDWTNPDTDGGGMMDGAECPPPNLCDGTFDPLDPSDDIVEDQIIFWANASAGSPDPTYTHYWRLNTYDKYTGTGFGLEKDMHPEQTITSPYANTTNLADGAFTGTTITWQIDYNVPVSPGNSLPLSAYAQDITWTDSATNIINRTNDTHVYTVRGGSVDLITVDEVEHDYDWGTNAAISQPSTLSPYELSVPSTMTDLQHPHSIVFNETQAAILGEVGAFAKLQAIKDYLQNTTYKINYNGIPDFSVIAGDDLAELMVGQYQEGTCTQFVSLFVIMSRLAGIPARAVNGYRDGSWTGSGFEVSSDHFAHWAEARLVLNNGDELGWVPFDPCPEPEEVQINNLTWTPTSYERDGTTEVDITGNLVFSSNNTGVEDISLLGFVVSPDDIQDVSPSRLEGRFGSTTTTGQGLFTIRGTIASVGAPGFMNMVVYHERNGYVNLGTITLDPFINLTDDSNITHESPNDPYQPILGAGATTTLSGMLQMSSDNFPANFTTGLEVVVTFNSQVNGSNTWNAPVSPTGAWAVDIVLDSTEPQRNETATLTFNGWVDTSQALPSPAFHLRASTATILLDIRQAPNLTATVQGPEADNEVLAIGENIYVNGTAVTEGISPVAIPGFLYLGMRQAGTGIAYREVFNVSVAGAFTHVHPLDPNFPMPAGEIEIELVFYPDQGEATDSESSLSGFDWRLKGVLSFEMLSGAQTRGDPTTIQIQVSDHLGSTVEFNQSGNYSLDFNGSWVETFSNPATKLLESSFTIDANTIAADYPLEINFNGSVNFTTSSQLFSLRVTAEVALNITLVDDWTHFGNTTYLIGDIYDPIHNTRLVNNQTSMLIELTDSNGAPIQIGNDDVALDPANGTFNISLIAPNIPSGVYDVQIIMVFASPDGNGLFYSWLENDPPDFSMGIISDYLVRTESPQAIIEMDNQITFTATVSDVQDTDTGLAGVSVEYIFDFGGANTSLGSSITDAEGNATFDWTPSGLTPGFYTVRMQVADDGVVSTLNPGDSWRIGNSTDLNLTIQVGSNIVIDYVDNPIIADTNFIIAGQIQDADGQDLIEPVQIDVFWLGNDAELLIENLETNATGTFNFSVPTDVNNDGTDKGNQQLVITVVDGSSPFYLTETGNQAVTVLGTTEITQISPINPQIVLRDGVVNLTSRLVESSDNDAILSGLDVQIKFGDDFLTPITTDGQGWANVSYTVPLDQKLGPVTVQFIFSDNPGAFLIGTISNLTNIEVRSNTVLTIDSPILANPVAGETFNITGTITSDNGSNLTTLQGNALSALVDVRINGGTTGFSTSNGTVQEDSTWKVTITLDNNFARGTHTLDASFTPTSNSLHYVGSTDDDTFDSRGFSRLRFIEPVEDNGQPSLNFRVVRGENLQVTVELTDNTLATMGSQDVNISLFGTDIFQDFQTRADNGTLTVSIPIPTDMSPGIAYINASYDGIDVTDGIVGVNASVSFVVLAATNITIESISDMFVVGDRLYVNGTLVDELGGILQENGAPKCGEIILYVDGSPVSTTFCDDATGAFSLEYVMPISSSAGIHTAEVRFEGGQNWVDPISVGSQFNAEYYLPDTNSSTFNVTVPTQINLDALGGEADRETTFTINGVLVDIMDTPLAGQTILLRENATDIALTTTTTDGNGRFSLNYYLPNDATLGPNVFDIIYNASGFYLASDTSSTWNVFSPVIVTVTLPEAMAVGDEVTINGTVSDNILQPVSSLDVSLLVESLPIGNGTSNNSGGYLVDWLVDDRFQDGLNTLVVEVPAQGWYRFGTTSTTFMLAHRSGLDLEFDSDTTITRGERWNFNGRLYDLDDDDKGLQALTVEIFLDNEFKRVALTDSDGGWTASIPATMGMARGSHVIKVLFNGSVGHLPVNVTKEVIVYSDVVLRVKETTDVAVRSDGIENIVITGQLLERGGENMVINSGNFTMGNGSGCKVELAGARCIDITDVSWDGAFFTLEATAPPWMTPGINFVVIEYEGEDSEYFNSAENVSQSFFLQVDARFEFNIEEIVENEQESVKGSVRIIANDTDLGLPGLSVSVFLFQENGTLLDDVTINTDGNGLAQFEFNADPPYGDYATYGRLNLEFAVNNQFGEFSVLTNSSMFDLGQDSAFGQIPYVDAEPPLEVPMWLYAVVIIGIIAGAYVVSIRRKRAEQIKQFADIFSYTAELLAAGDSIRESIFNCYESLCLELMKQGFLRRDFETVREFEMAVRKALPISEESIRALDATFEEARYSRNEMDNSHKVQAQEALTRVIGELKGVATQE